jgi:hypothetical protein
MKIWLAKKRELYIFQHKESRQQAYVSSYINIVVINNRFTRITRAPFFGFRYGCGFSLFSSRQFCDLPSDEFSVHVDRYSEDNPLLDFIPERQKTMIKTELIWRSPLQLNLAVTSCRATASLIRAYRPLSRIYVELEFYM